ncbi:hypothetical protein GWI33_020818 [Rhynchophorus ferrugineus]|uniref:Uncharacterized protein n=1 Tax=Rhynchophorus ferrugineus TaxID=354439 RepID=A0A834HVP2_RHYFE|nr:hypothetical protein GWI33_020818 [Rhynchophorus ferrugineus]
MYSAGKHKSFDKKGMDLICNEVEPIKGFVTKARNKPADGSGHVTQPRPRTPTHASKGGPKTPCKTSQKPVAAQQKGQPIKQAPAKVEAAAAAKKTKKPKKGKHHQHDLIVTINLVSVKFQRGDMSDNLSMPFKFK